MRPLPLAILGIAAYLVFLGVSVPARWLAARLESAAPGRYEVHQAQGTIWKGDARAVLNAPGGTLVVDRVEWDFLPARLLQGRLAFRVRARGAGFEAAYEAGRKLAGGWELRGLTAQADSALATAALPLVARFRPEGRVSASADAIEVAGDEMRGDLRIEWKDAAVGLSELRPLGSYRAQLRGEGGPAKLEITTLDGALRIQGRGTVDALGRLAFSGEARAEGANARALDPLMGLLGPPRPDGSRALEWRLR
jgi:general secretion pathway protein N